MASEKKRGGAWMGHPTLEKDHEHELHLASALHEFQGGMPRHEAERRALSDYRHEWHSRAAAHHFAGIKASHATGNTEDAQKHHALYSLHVKALGEDPMGPVPEAVRKYHGSAGTDKKQRHVYSFKGHDADQFLVQPVTKSECELVDLKKSETVVEALRAASSALADRLTMPPGVIDYLADLSGEPRHVEEMSAGAALGAEPQQRPSPQDPILVAVGQLKKTLDTIALVKNILAQVEKKAGSP